MQVQARRSIDRGSVPVTVDEAPVKESVDELAARRRFNALIAPHMSMLRAKAIQLCRSHYEADDIVQDTLLRAFRTRNPVHDVTRMRPWLLTILTRTFIDATRRRRRRLETAALVDDDNILEPVPDEPAPWHNIGVDDLRAAVEQLTDDVRDTYRMFALEGRDQAAIAKAQRIATATVGTRIFRARKQLRALLTAAVLGGASR